jgi:hypothetical protein
MATGYERPDNIGTEPEPPPKKRVFFLDENCWEWMKEARAPGIDGVMAAALCPLDD